MTSNSELNKIDFKKSSTIINKKMANNMNKNKIDFKNKIDLENKNKSTNMDTMNTMKTSSSTNEKKKLIFKKLISKKQNNNNTTMETIAFKEKAQIKNKIDFKNKIDLENKNMSTNTLPMENTKTFKSTNEKDINVNGLKVCHYNNIRMNKTTSTNMNDNCKSTTCFEQKCYYNIVNSDKAKQLKKENKYTSPLSMAISDRDGGDITFKYDEEKGAKTWTKYGNMTYENLNKYGWKVNNHLFEIIPKGHPFKLYFDIDKRFVSEENNQVLMKTLYKLIKDIMKIDMAKCELAIAYGKGIKDDYTKVSWHIIVENIVFANMDDCKKVMKTLQYEVITNDKYDELRSGVLDFNVYKDNQAFKLPYQTKAFKKIQQRPLDGDKQLSNFLLTNITTSEFYDVSSYKEIDVKKKTIKAQNGKQISFNFDEAIIIKQYVEAIGKKYKLPPIVGLTKKDGLAYYLASIPNNEKVPRIVWKTIGWCISRITKNSDEGLQLWAKWTSQYKPTTSEDLMEEYKSHNIDKGYGWKMLYNMARIYNGKMDKNDSIYEPLFNDTPTYEMDYKEFTSRYNGQSIDVKQVVNDYDIINIKAPMGCGKSYDLKQLFAQKKYKSIVYFSCKRAFASSMVSDFKKYGFKNYLDVEHKSEIVDINRIICSVESIQYCRDKYDLVIIDESESICDNLMGAMFIKNKPIEGATNIYNMIRNSKKIMIMDAYLTSRSYDMIKDILKEDITTKKSILIKNKFKYEQRQYIDCDKRGFVKNLKTLINDGKRCAVVCGSKKLSDSIKLELPNITIKAYDNRNPLPLTCDVNDEWKDCQLLMYTPTITAGISYDPQCDEGKDISKHFDNLFIYCVNKGSCHFRDTIQAHKRVRDFKSKQVYICINDNFKGHPYEIMPLTKEGIIEIEDKYKASLFGSEVNTLKSMDTLNYIYNINIHNKLEKNISQILLRGFAKRYLYEENIIANGNDQSMDEIMEDIDEWDYSEIDDITYEKKMEIKSMMDDPRPNKPIVDDEEIKQFVKYGYKNETIKPTTSETIKQEFFDNFYQEPMERKKNNSVKSFKQMLYDIKYEFTKFNEWRDGKAMGSEMEGKPLEMYDMKLKRYEHLIKFFNKLGFIKEDKIDIDNEFVGDDFNKLGDDYKDIDVKALNTMMNDGYIRITKKDEAKKSLNSKQIKGIFNQLLMDEFGMEVCSKGLKYVRVEGKKKKLTKMGVRNYCAKATKKDSESEKKEKEEYEKKFGAKDYNKFNVYREKFSEDEPQFSPSDWMEDNSDDEDSEDCSEYDNSDDMEEDDEEEEINDLDMGIKTIGVFKMKPKEKKITNISGQNIILGGCSVCGKPCMNSMCMKCMMATN